MSGPPGIEPPPILSLWFIACCHNFDGGLVVLGPKCHAVDWAAPAVSVVHWPSGPIRCCAGCAAHSADVADRGLGMHLHVEAIYYQRCGLDDAEQRFAAMDLM